LSHFGGRALPRFGRARQTSRTADDRRFRKEKHVTVLVSTASPAVRVGVRRILVHGMVLAVSALTVLGMLLAAGARPAAANTPSDASYTYYVGATPGYRGLPITVGWTHDHAWVISSYGAALAEGAGQIADRMCEEISGEEIPHFDPVASSCGDLVRDVVAQLVEGHPALTDHGVWAAIYVWGGLRTTGGSW
jgi:hypothetical protein